MSLVSPSTTASLQSPVYALNDRTSDACREKQNDLPRPAEGRCIRRPIALRLPSLERWTARAHNQLNHLESDTHAARTSASRVAQANSSVRSFRRPPASQISRPNGSVGGVCLL